MPIHVLNVTLSCLLAAIVEGEAGFQHNIESNAQAPDVDALARVAPVFQKLGSNVGR